MAYTDLACGGVAFYNVGRPWMVRERVVVSDLRLVDGQAIEEGTEAEAWLAICRSCRPSLRDRARPWLSSSPSAASDRASRDLRRPHDSLAPVYQSPALSWPIYYR